MKRLVLLLLVMVVLFGTTFALAHSGKTDKNGGHHDTSTGEYHYHHGHPAHQHPNGVCPYDSTKSSSNSSGHSASRYTPPSSKATDYESMYLDERTKRMDAETTIEELKSEADRAKAISYIAGGGAAVETIVFVRTRGKRKQSTKEAHDE